MACSNRFLHKCAGKIKHKTLLGAQYALDNNPNAKNANIYKCDCGFFHIGTPHKKKSKKIRLDRKANDNNEHKKKYKNVRKFKY
jgi:hypothetical protein